MPRTRSSVRFDSTLSLMTQFTDASIRAKSSARTKVSASLTCTRTCGLAMPIGMLENLRRRACGASAGLVAASAGLVAAQAAARVSADLNMAGRGGRQCSDPAPSRNRVAS
jgi:hypothetical protein